MHIAWNDLQTLEALVRAGTLEGAARVLGLTHTSVSRRLVALEAELDLPLFTRGARLVPTPLARQLAKQAAGMHAPAAGAAALVAQARRDRDDRVVVTTSDALAPLLMRGVAALSRPVCVDVVVGDAELGLGPGEVDLALRPAVDPSGALRGRRLGRLQLGVFCAVDAARSDLWVLPSAALRARRSMPWWRHVPADAPSVVTCDALLAVRDACAAGLGCAVLPSFLVHGDARVRRLRALDGGPPVWLLAPPTAASSRAGRALRAELAAALVGVEGAFERPARSA